MSFWDKRSAINSNLSASAINYPWMKVHGPIEALPGAEGIQGTTALWA